MSRLNRLFFIPLFVLVLPACKEDAPGARPEAASGDNPAAATAAARPYPWKNNGCELVTDAEVESLFAIDRREDVLNTQTLPDKSFCLRSWNKSDWKERESNNEKPDVPYQEPRNTLVIQVLDYTSAEIADAQFNMLKRDRRDIYPEDVDGIGDEALWSNSTTTLVVKHGHLVLNVTLEHQDNPHDNLPMARKVAEVALRKM